MLKLYLIRHGWTTWHTERRVAGWLNVPLELSEVLAAIYDEAAYDLSIDYATPPPPPIAAEDAAWLQTILENVTTP